MKNKLDKNSKPDQGKSKESASSAKPKPKAAAKSGPLATSKKSKPQEASGSSQGRGETKPSSESAKSAGGSAKSPADSKRSVPSPVSKRPAAGRNSGDKTAARRRGNSGETSAEELSLEEFSISLIKPGETKERIWRTKSFQQFPAQREFGFPEVAPELPGQYSQPKLVLMPKDPEYMFCYWELTPSLLQEKEKEKVSTGNYRETLKINWESRSLFEPNFTFIPVFFWARKWYFGVPQVGQRYQVELGWLSDSGHFISIIRSNLSELPESWAASQKRLAEEGEVLAYSSRHTKTLGSSEHLVVEDARAFVPEWNLSSESMSSSSWSKGPSAAAVPEAEKADSKAVATAPKGRKTRPAVPKARLEVSGKVLPGTQVLVGGNSVEIDSMGYFKIEFPFNRNVLDLELTSREGASRSFSYDLKELVLT